MYSLCDYTAFHFAFKPRIGHPPGEGCEGGDPGDVPIVFVSVLLERKEEKATEGT
jgi:hypothetical protein